MKKFFVSTYIIFKEGIRILIRNPLWIFVGLFEPVVYLLLFMPFLKGVTTAPGFPAESATRFFVPGLIIMTAMFNSSYAGFGVLDLLESGFIERLRVTPVNRLSLALGFVLQSVTVLFIQSLIVCLVSLFFGFTPNFVGMTFLFMLVILMGICLSSISYTAAFIVKDGGVLASVINFVILPLFLLSGTMLPLSFAPKSIQIIALLNPFTYAVNASRFLSDGNIYNSQVLISFVVFIFLCVLTLQWFIKIMKETVA
ncbi:MAG: ABC transporter permease [Ignavibacteriaceae bacterium]|jgi:ABC-2 type transport system permease protein